MRDANDNSTLEMLPVAKKRGRPSTGTAMTNAERQAKHRRESVIVTLNDAEWSEVVSALCRVAVENLDVSDEFRSAARKIYRAGISRAESMPAEFLDKPLP
ncbi:hypothetical protein [Chromobacterium sp. IIBBL 290-4]|uniref:hypothetical protein n=1 Tax=Chromobacterium sp. IIBBL 290-4 TaxID=2953890 RepID=UPI0020B9019A|nr:hypothetical protein [Chromobacterium sp. IIBBL 290-4]UTH73576.1 hypothetical protein NKT35_18845 [Chromobacterium sp. IIBBL 290-4]